MHQRLKPRAPHLRNFATQFPICPDDLQALIRPVWDMRLPHSSELRTHRRALPALITTCSANRDPLFADGRCAQIILDQLQWLEGQRRMVLFAAVVMPDHLHFVADPLDSNWPALMHSLKRHSARTINALLGRSGAVWQNQYHDRQIFSDEHFAKAIEYCALNPVRAGLTAEGERYRYFWSRDERGLQPLLHRG